MNKRSHLPAHRAIMLLIVVCVLWAMQACTVIRVVQTDSPSADRAASGQQFGYDTVIITSLWKGKNRVTIPNVCHQSSISRFKVTTKPGDVILGFLTVGLVVKQRIEWDCGQRSGSSEIEPRTP